MGSLKRLKPQTVECLIANTIRNNSPKMYDRLDEEGLILHWFPSAFIADDAVDSVTGPTISHADEARNFARLSRAIGKLVELCETECETMLESSLRYIKADIDVELLRFKEWNQLKIDSGH